MFRNCMCDKHRGIINKVCPCSICLVKVICDTTCNLYREFIAYVLGEVIEL